LNGELFETYGKLYFKPYLVNLGQLSFYSVPSLDMKLHLLLGTGHGTDSKGVKGAVGQSLGEEGARLVLVGGCKML
jgi:hypothetical protein